MRRMCQRIGAFAIAIGLAGCGSLDTRVNPLGISGGETSIVTAKFAGSVDGGINLLGNMYNYRGPMLWAFSLIHDHATTADTILGVIDGELERLARAPIGPDELERVRVKARSDLYDVVGGTFGVGRADLLACLALFDDDPARINAIEDSLAAVTPADMQAVVRDFLQPHQRTVVIVEPGAGEAEVAA